MKPIDRTETISEAVQTPSHYRPDIDGLRAIAILMVIAYHGFPEWIHGGFVGVDIFFVISGYLITGVIFPRVVAGNFSIADFYARRIRRIFPALLLVTFATFVAGWFLLAPRDFESLGSNIAGGALFVQNFVLLGQIGYFDIEAAKKPLLHLWSLGIEEQYYVAWPLLLLLFHRKNWNVWLLTILSAIASFCLGLAVFQKNPDLAFYLPLTRAWELLAGSAVSIFFFTAETYPTPQWVGLQLKYLVRLTGSGLRKLAPKLNNRNHVNLTQEFLSASAIAALIFVIIRHKPFTPYPGSAAVISVFATIILILTPNTPINRLFLASRSMVFIGLISYPLYLWHFPLMAYARILSEDPVSPPFMMTIIAVSVLLAWLTYRFIERPIRFGKQMVRVKIAALVAGIAGLGVLGLGVTATEGLPSRLPPTVRNLLLNSTKVAWGYGYWRGKCLINDDPSTFSDACSGKGKSPLIFVWGDSFAAALLPGLDHFAGPRGFGISSYTASACPPLIGYVYDKRPFCKATNDFVLNRIAKEIPETVILHSTWELYALNRAELEKGLGTTIAALKALHIKNIILLGPPPTWKGDGLAADVLDYYYQSGMLLPERTFYRSQDQRTREADAWMQARAQTLGVTYISARDILCDDEGCLARIGENGSILTAIDLGHLTEPASILLVASILDQLVWTEKSNVK